MSMLLPQPTSQDGTSFVPSVPSRRPSVPPAKSEAQARRDRLGNPVLHEAVLKVLRRGRIPAAERTSLLSETIKRALECRFLPDDDRKCCHYVCGMARNVAREFLGERRRRRAQVPFDESARGAPGIETHIDDRLTLERIMGKLGLPERRAYRWFAQTVLLGDTYEEIAGEEEIGSKTVWDAVAHARKMLLRRLNAAALVAFVAIFLWAVIRDMRPRQDVADPNKLPKTEEPAPAPKPEGKATAPVPSVADAQALRTRALSDCKRRSWLTCLDGLEKARQIDPSGDGTPMVEKARADALAALEAKTAPRAAPRRGGGGMAQPADDVREK